MIGEIPLSVCIRHDHIYTILSLSLKLRYMRSCRIYVINTRIPMGTTQKSCPRAVWTPGHFPSTWPRNSDTQQPLGLSSISLLSARAGFLIKSYFCRRLTWEASSLASIWRSEFQGLVRVGRCGCFVDFISAFTPFWMCCSLVVELYDTAAMQNFTTPFVKLCN